MSESDADRAGLVPTHAYALLDIRKVQVRLHFVACGKEKIKRKNKRIK